MRSQTALAFIVAFTAACSSPASRIRRRQAAFDAYPQAIQANIRAGQVEVGYTREQVEIAMGPPTRTYTRKTAAGTQDVWAYGGSSVRPSLGFGVGRGRGGMYSSGGVGLSSMDDLRDRTRLVMQDDVVVSVEKLQR